MCLACLYAHVLKYLRAYVLSCQHALRAYGLMCQRALRAYVLACQRDLRAYVLTYQPVLRANMPCVLHAHVKTSYPQ